MPRQNRAKIVATLGPASSTREMIAALVEAGADVFRLNFSHGSHEEHRAALRHHPRRSSGERPPIGILADLQGPKLRVGRMAAGPFELREGERLRFDMDDAPGTPERVPLPHPEVFAALSPGVQLLIDDGKIRLEVEKADKSTATARVLVGGKLSERKGVSVVGAVLPVSALTRQGPHRPRFRALPRRRLGGPLLRPAPGGHGRGQGHRGRAGPACWPSWRSRPPSSSWTRSSPARTR